MKPPIKTLHTKGHGSRGLDQITRTVPKLRALKMLDMVIDWRRRSLQVPRYLGVELELGTPETLCLIISSSFVLVQ